MRSAERFVYQFDTGPPDLVTHPAMHRRVPNDVRQRQHKAHRNLFLAPPRTSNEFRHHRIHTRLTAHQHAERIRVHTIILDESLTDLTNIHYSCGKNGSTYPASLRARKDRDPDAGRVGCHLGCDSDERTGARDVR